MKKISLKTIKDGLTRDELRLIKGGSGGTHGGSCYGGQCGHCGGGCQCVCISGYGMICC